MAQSEAIYIDLDITDARKRIKHIRSEAQEADRDLARLEERLGTLAAKLAPFNVTLEVRK